MMKEPQKVRLTVTRLLKRDDRSNLKTNKELPTDF